MFGYFKLDRECPREIFNDYKKYYCFLCRTLQRYYGPVARFTLSYDVAFYLILVSDDAYLGQIKKVSCLNRDKHLTKALEHPLSREIASLNILLSAAKLEDDILDEHSISSRIISGLLGRAIRRAKENSPHMWQIISGEYAALRELERRKADIHTLEECFARMMLRLARECFHLEDENLKEGTFNPFVLYGSFRELKDHHYIWLTDHIHGLYANTPRQTATGMNGLITNRILFRGIPDATVRVLTRRR